MALTPKLADQLESAIANAEVTPDWRSIIGEERLRLRKIIIEWRGDESADVELFGSYPTFRKTCRGHFANEVDVRATIEAYEKDGVTNEDARKYTAQDVERVRRWIADQWSWVGCIATAHASPDSAPESLEEVGTESVWGIESDCGEKYRKMIESEQLGELRAALESEGYSSAEFDSVEVEYAGDYYFSEPPDPDSVAPIPADTERYTVQQDGSELVWACRECGDGFPMLGFDPQAPCPECEQWEKTQDSLALPIG